MVSLSSRKGEASWHGRANKAYIMKNGGGCQGNLSPVSVHLLSIFSIDKKGQKCDRLVKPPVHFTTSPAGTGRMIADSEAGVARALEEETGRGDEGANTSL
jgi:hypothetical protein